MLERMTYKKFGSIKHINMKLWSFVRFVKFLRFYILYEILKLNIYSCVILKFEIMRSSDL